jgi:hypothetical protein
MRALYACQRPFRSKNAFLQTSKNIKEISVIFERSNDARFGVNV